MVTIISDRKGGIVEVKAINTNLISENDCFFIEEANILVCGFEKYRQWSDMANDQAEQKLFFKHVRRVTLGQLDHRIMQLLE
jgi:hypothetical protein